MAALYRADLAVVVGFAMSDFDAMAQLQFANLARARAGKNQSLRVVVVDPCADRTSKDRFRRVFRCVRFIKKRHQDTDWTSLR